MGDSSEAARRLRLTVDGMRGSPGRVRSAVDTLRSIPGVREVTADLRTGSVAIRYEPHPVGGLTVGPSLWEIETPREDGLPAKIPAPATVLTRIVETVVIVALEVALQRALGPFWPKRC